MKHLVIGYGRLVHAGIIIPAALSTRTDPEAQTLCNRGWHFAGLPRETDAPVTCPECLRALSRTKEAA